MAGDWLPIRFDLHEDPSVLALAEDLNISEDEVVGKLVRLWRWASSQSTDGRLQNVRIMSAERALNLQNFIQSVMKNTPWLRYETDELNSLLIFEKWERWLSKSAKRRALENRRKREKRGRKTSAKRPQSVRKKSALHNSRENTLTEYSLSSAARNSRGVARTEERRKVRGDAQTALEKLETDVRVQCAKESIRDETEIQKRLKSAMSALGVGNH